MSLRDLTLALIIFGGIPFMLVRPYYGLLAWSWLGYMNPHRLTWGFAYSFPWVQLVAMVTLGALLFTKYKRPIPWTPITVLLLVFTVWTGISTLFALSSDAAWQEFEKFIKIQMMVIVTLVLVIDRKQIQWLIWLITYSIGFYGIKGGAFVLATGGSYRVWGPAQSFIASNNWLALALCMVLPLMRYLQMQQTNKWARIAIGAGMALTAAGIVGTYSRAGLITLVAVGLFLFWKSRGKLMIAIAIAILVPLILTFMPAKWLHRANSITDYQEQTTYITRVNTWQYAFNMALDRPLVGGGFDAYTNTEAFWRYAPSGAWTVRAIHSAYFRVLGEQGFVGLALFLALMAAGWFAAARIRRQTKHDPNLKWAYDLTSMLQVSLVAYLVDGMASGVSYFDLIYQLLALFVVIGIEVKKTQSAADPKSSQAFGRKHTASSKTQLR